MHLHTIEDERGDTVDVLPFCSDSCHHDYAGNEYQGWSGAHETEFTTWCVACGVVIPGEDACDCQMRNVVVARFRSEEGETCEHGNRIQLPASYLTRLEG